MSLQDLKAKLKQKDEYILSLQESIKESKLSSELLYLIIKKKGELSIPELEVKNLMKEMLYNKEDVVVKKNPENSNLEFTIERRGK